MKEVKVYLEEVVADKAFLSPKRLSQNQFSLKNAV